MQIHVFVMWFLEHLVVNFVINYSVMQFVVIVCGSWCLVEFVNFG